MKLGPVRELDKRKKTMSKIFDDDVLSTNCDVIVIFPINSQFGAIQKPDSGRMICKTYIFINSNLLSHKNWKRAKKSLTQLSHYCTELRYCFCHRMLIFCIKMLASAKLGGPWYWKVYFLKLNIWPVWVNVWVFVYDLSGCEKSLPRLGLMPEL